MAQEHPHLVRKKLFNPLTGRELRDMIVHEISQTLDNHGYFRNNLTYPNLHFHWILEVRSFPNEPSEFKVEVEQVMRTDDWKHDPLKEPHELTFEGGEEVTQPEKTREEIQSGSPNRAVLPDSRESDPDSDAYQPKGGRMVRVKTPGGAGEDFDFENEKF
jgi:hypothetical protein